MKPARHRWRARLATFFLVAGIAGVATWCWSIGHQAVYEDWSNWAFDRQASGQNLTWKDYLKDRWRELTSFQHPTQTATRASNPEQPEPERPDLERRRPADDSLIGRLSIPGLNVRAIVRQGTEAGVLSVALGHIPGTALPGEPGNVAVAGHRDTLFRGLRNVRVGDRIEFETPGKGTYFYVVESTTIVSPREVSVLNAGLHPELTLVTCYPFNYVGSAPYRFIVKARQVERDARPQEHELVAEQTAPPAPRVRSRLSLKPLPYDSTLVSRNYRQSATY